jgi:hypothetical protein
MKPSMFMTHRQLWNFAVCTRCSTASSTMGTGSFPTVKNGRGVTLTPQPLLVPWSRESRAIPLLPLWTVRPVQSLSVCTRVHFTFTVTLCWGPPIFGNFIKLSQIAFEVWSDTQKNVPFFLKIIRASMFISFYPETFTRNRFLFDKQAPCYAQDPRKTGLGLHVKNSFSLYDFGKLSLLINFRRNRPIKKFLEYVFNGSRLVVCQQHTDKHD